MSKQILVNDSPYETRVATLEDGELRQLHIEREEDRNVVGNIYKGVVKRVLPGMQAAFLELGLERTAFLYVDDIIDEPFGTDIELMDDEEGAAEASPESDPAADEAGYPAGEEIPPSPEAQAEAEALRDRQLLEAEREGTDAVAAPAVPSPIPVEGGQPEGEEGRGRRQDRGRGNNRGGQRRGGRRMRPPRRTANIQDLLKEGQEILVQVAKAPIGTKGARLTTHISLPGRNVVLMPTVQHIGVSRRIESDRERRRLRDIMVGKINPPRDVGFIIRTVAEGKTLRDLKSDTDYLLKLWEQIQKDAKTKRAPTLIHEDLALAMRAVRDFFTDEVDAFIVDDPESYDRISSFVGEFMPRLKPRVKAFRGPSQLFEHYGIEAEISRALGKKVWLKSGGYLLIDQSEALTSIDVNTGRYVGSKSLEETILKTNLEAVKEIAYQLRVRNVGGIIIIDLIDMEAHENREKVYRALQESLTEDKAKTNILKISELGLVEMTRKRTHEDLIRYLTEACNYCEGRGYHKSKRTVCFEIFREIEKEALNKTKNIVVFASSFVVNRMAKEEKEYVQVLEKRFGKSIAIKMDPTFHVEQFEVFSKQ